MEFCGGRCTAQKLCSDLSHIIHVQRVVAFRSAQTGFVTHGHENGRCDSCKFSLSKLDPDPCHRYLYYELLLQLLFLLLPPLMHVLYLYHQLSLCSLLQANAADIVVPAHWVKAAAAVGLITGS